MTDSAARLYDAVIAAQAADSAKSRTAKLMRAGRAKMAKKLAEEAVEVVIDAMQGQPEAVVRESADLLYDWCIEAAHKPHAMWTMGAIAFAESSFFPVPPDIMLIPMSLARPQRAYVMALWCPIASVTGGLVGYAIGALLYDSVGQWLIQLYGYGNKVDAFRAAYAQWGAWIILLKGLTPIPYKIVTVTSGFANYN